MKIAFNPSTVAALITPPNNKDITFDLRGRNIFARGVKFLGTDTWRDIKINNVSIGSNILDLRNGSNTTLTNTNGVVTINSTWRPVVDNLTSDSTTSSLSAKQGKVLKALIDGKSDSGHTHDDRYLKLTGGIMASNALITFADSGSWGTDKGPQGARGGLYWTGQSDYAKLYAEETAGDNLDLVIQFGDDNSNGLSIRNKANTQTSYISAGGVITTGTFKGNLDWSYITNKPSSYTPSAHTHAWNSLTHSSTTENQAILTNGKANGWKLYTLNIARWDNAANNAHSHSNKSVLDGITSGLVNNWNTAYNFVSTITGEDTDKVINKWDEIVNFLAGITEDNKLNTLLNSKLSILLLSAKDILTTKTNNALFWVNTKGNASTITTGPFTDHPYALLSVTNYNLNVENSKFFYRSRLAFSSAGDIKVASCHHENEYKLDETWYNVLTSKNSGINGSTIKLNGTSITVYSSSTADGRYVKKSGDTMTGVLTIDTTNFGALTIKRNDDANGASIQFRGKSSVYGYIGLNNSTKDKQFLRWNSDTSKTYIILDTSSTYVSSGKGVINGTTITQVDNATNSTNSINARKLVNWYSARPTSLNTQFGDGSLRIFYATSSTTEGKPAEDSHILHLAWDNNGGWDTQLAVHTRSGKVSTRAQNSGTWQPWKTLAFTTDIPSSLKNPYSLTTFGVVYDGSAAKTVTTSTFISLVTEGTSTITDGTMFITSYASNSGFADTNAVNIPYKRKAIHLWEYVRAKTDSLYATKSHNHDDRYLKLTGGIMTGTINRRSGGSTISGRDHAIIRLTYAPGGSSWNPIACVDTETGTWTLGHLSSGSSDTNFHFCFSTNADYNAGNNNGNYVTLRNKVGTIALLSDIPSSLKNPHALTISLNGTSLGPYDGSAAKNINITPSSIGAATSGHNHDGRYVYNYGGTQMDGASINKNALGMATNSGITGDWWHILQAAWNGEYRWNSLIAFPTLNRNGMYYRSGLDDNTAWGAWVKLLDVNNYSSILDSRYYTESEINTKLGAYLPLTGGTMTGNLSFSNSGTGFRGINYGTMGDNDLWRIGGAATGSNGGYMEIATADDGNEPIYVRQYTGVFSSVKRTLTLLDANGYTHFPSYINIGGNENNNSSPDRVWGSNGSDSYLRSYRTSALRVAYAVNANSATTASSANKLTTARNIALGTDLRGSANFDGSSNITISANINACTVRVSSTNGLPFKRIAHFETGGSWNDNALLLYISLGYINGSNGICRVEFRTDNISSSSTSVTASAAVRWLVRNGYGLDSLYAGYYVTTSKAYIDIYLKTTSGYQGTVIRVLLDSRGGINSNVLLINSYYLSDTNHKEAYNSIEAASTALYNRAYTRIVSGSDVGTVSYSNSTGSVHWNNVTNKPSTFSPAAHTHTVFNNNLMIKGTNGVSDSASIHLGIGDSDTGFKWISDGKCLIYANNTAVGEWTSGGMNWFKNPTVNGNKVWNAGNDGSGSGLDADLLDGWHLDSIRKNAGYSWSAKYRINNWSRIIKIDNYSNILLAINFSQNGLASNHLYLISTGYSCGNIVQLGANGYSSNSAIKIRLTENTATSHNVEIYSTYGYNGATELSINCNYTRIDGNSTITTYLIYTVGGGTVRKEITSSYSKIVANLQGNSDTTTKLQTPRQINGTNFDGSANITTSYWGTTRTISLTGAITGSVSTNGGSNITINTTYGTGNITNLDNRYVKKAGDTMLGNLAFASGKQTRWTAHGTSYITDGNADSGTSLGSDLANLVISSWLGVSFTTSCSGQTYTNKTAVGINCRTGIVYAANFVGPLQGNASSATKLATARSIWGHSFNGTADVNGTIYINNNNSSEGAIRLNNNVNSNARISAIDSQVIFNTDAAIRFGGTSWDWNVWAGLKYTHSNKTIYLGLADNSIFNANSALSGGSLRFPGISNVYATTFNGSLSGNASTATNADKVDGYHSSSFLTKHTREGAYNIDHLTDFVTRDLQPKSEINIEGTKPYDGWGIVTVLKTDNGTAQLVFDGGSNMYFRSSYGSEHGYVTSTWKQVANLSSNVASASKLQTARKIWGQSFDGTANVDNTLRIRQTTGNYCEGIRIQTGDSTWATIVLGATGDSGTNANAWSIHRKSDNNFAISRNSSDGTNGLVMTSVGMGLGTTAPTLRLDVVGNIRVTGQIIREASGLTWINGRKGALLRETTSTGYHTLWSLKTTNGSWDFGEYNSSGWNNIPVLSYITDTNFNSGNNTTTYQIRFPLDSGTIALTKNIPTSLKSPYSLTLKANGTTLATYDGSSAKEANFTYANVGAAPASHTHTAIVAEDLRAKYPGQILNPQRMKLSFLAASTLGIKNDGSYYDVITVRSYADSSGGSDNALLFSKNSNSLYHTRFAFGSTSSWGSPLLIIDSGNIGSQSVAYASKAGSVAWDSITGKPSSFTPSSHTHSWTSITDKLVAGNEFNIVNAGFNADIWFNYKPINDSSKTASIHTYIMGNGAKGMASVTASGFIKNGSNDSYVLLGGGGHKTISSLSVNYASSAGNADTVDRYHANTIYNAPSFTVNNSNTSNTYILLATITISGTSLACAEFTTLFQNRECLDSSSFILSGAIRRNSTTSVTATLSYITLHTKTPRNIYLRSDDGVTFLVYIQSAASTWTTYYRAIPIVDSGNITYSNIGTTSPISGSVLNITATKGGNVNYASSAGDADTLDSYHANGLLTALSNSNNGISITVGGTTKSISNISVNYSNSAGNADTLDNTHLNGIFTAFGNNGHNITATIGGTTKSFLVNWAADSGKLGGYHASDLLTSVTNTNNGISVTVGGTTKSVSNISVNYASSAGSVAWDNVTGKPSTFAPSAHTHKWADITDHITKLSLLINDKGFVTGSVSGKTITINGNSTTWSDTWRPITDDYKLGESGTSLSSLGSLTLYNDLLDRIPNTTDYYWANVKISTSSSTTTSPTVHTLTATRVCAGYNPEIDNSISCSNWFRSSGATGWYNATYLGGWYMSDTSWVRTHNGVGIYTSGQIYSPSSIRMGNIYLQNTNEINSASGIHLNYQNSGNISLCAGGGNVGIGTISPSYKLDVNGNIHSSGTINCNALNVGSTLSIKDSVISCSASDISIESKESGYLLIDSHQVLRYDLDSIYISNKTSFGNRLGLATGILGINYSTDDATVLIGSLRESSLFEFRPAMDGLLLFLKVGKLYSNTYFWCTAKNCEVIKANNFSTYLARNGRKDCFGDGCARIFIYKLITESWYEFYCG